MKEFIELVGGLLLIAAYVGAFFIVLWALEHFFGIPMFWDAKIVINC